MRGEKSNKNHEKFNEKDNGLLLLAGGMEGEGEEGAWAWAWIELGSGNLLAEVVWIPPFFLFRKWLLHSLYHDLVYSCRYWRWLCEWLGN